MSERDATPGPEKETGFAESVAQQHPAGGRPGGRKEVGDTESSRLHPPHVAEAEADSPLQDDHESPEEVPALPANASGTDKVTTGEQTRSIDPASMYDRRPEEDKNRPPSQRATD